MDGTYSKHQKNATLKSESHQAKDQGNPTTLKHTKVPVDKRALIQLHRCLVEKVNC